MFRRRIETVYHIENAAYWEQGQIILDEAHTLIAGSTGCGKSTLIHKLMWTALAKTPASVRFCLIDMKGGVELGRYANLPHTISFAKDLPSALSTLDWVTDEMHRRVEYLFQSGGQKWSGAHIYVVVDELAFLLQSGGQDALRRLIHISQQARAAGIHLILATQDPSRRGIPAALQANMTCCIGMRCKSAIESRQIIGVAGCETLPRYGTAYITLGPDLYTLPINPMSEAVYAERIRYWQTPSACSYTRKIKKGA